MADNQLYNAQTLKPETLPQEDIPSAILTGTHAYKAGSQINILSPDGEAASIAAEQLPDALKQNYQIETPKQGAIREYLEDNQGLKGDIKVGLQKFGDEALMGVPGIIYDKTGDPLEVAKNEALKQEHTAAKVTGSVAGFAASLFTGSPVFKGAAAAGELAENLVAKQLAAAGIERGSQSAAKDIVARMATKAAQLGVEGAVVSAPQAITEGMLGDPEQAGESLLYGAGIGSTLGLAGGALSPLFEKLGAKYTDFKAAQASAEGISGIEDFQNERAAKALGFTKGNIKKLKGGWDEAKDLASEIKGSKLEDGTPLFTALSTTEQLADNLEKFKQEAGDRIGRVYETIDRSGQKNFNPKWLTGVIEDEYGDFYRSPINRDETGIYNNILDSIKLRGEQPLTLSEGKGMLDEIDKVAYPNPKASFDPTPKQQLAQNIRRIIRDELNKAAEQGALTIGDKQLGQELLDSNHQYMVSKRVEKALKDKVASEQGNKFFGLTDTIAGAGAASGFGVVPALASVLAKKMAEKYGNQILATLPVEGLLHAEQALKASAKKLDQIPAVLDSILKSGGSSVNAIRPADVGALSRFVADDGKNRDEKLEHLASKLSQFAANPSLMTNKIASQTVPFSQFGAPQIADSFGAKTAQAMNYLNHVMPKGSEASNPLNPTKFRPADAQIAEFERKLSVVHDPYSVIDRMRDGTLNKDHMEALHVVYPKTYEAIKSRIIDHMLENKTKIPYAQRLKLSLLMGVNIDGTIKPQAIQAYQASYLKPQNPAPNMKPASLGIAQRSQTDLQQREFRP